MSSPAGLLYLCVDVFASAVVVAPGQLLGRLANYWGAWPITGAPGQLLGRLAIAGAPGQSWALMRQRGEQENIKCGVCHSFSACEHS